MTETWVRYTHLEKLYGYLPGMPAAAPGVFGLTANEYDSVRARFADRARAAAAELLADPAFAARVDALPFGARQTVLAVGDSVTDDLQSWAEILRHLLALRRPRLGVRVINGGLSAHTTTMVLRRWPAVAAGVAPDWVLCALGGNDVTRVGPEPATTQVSPDVSVANLRRMREIAPDPKWVWLTPVPVDEDRVARDPGFLAGCSAWHNADIRALAGAMRGLDGPLVDLVGVFGVPADPTLQGDDGVHPTSAGQAAIARALVETLTS
jgi:lysophospholipase L1-like esterase